MRFKGIKFMRQYDANDCGIACIKMLAKYYDIDPNFVSVPKLRQLKSWEKLLNFKLYRSLIKWIFFQRLLSGFLLNLKLRSSSPPRGQIRGYIKITGYKILIMN
jgi:hypothetical protein